MSVVASETAKAGEFADFLAGWLEDITGRPLSALEILDGMAVFGVVGASDEYMRRLKA